MSNVAVAAASNATHRATGRGSPTTATTSASPYRIAAQRVTADRYPRRLASSQIATAPAITPAAAPPTITIVVEAITPARGR